MIDQDQFRINVYRAVPVQIVDGGTQNFAFSAAKTPRAIAQQAGASCIPEDMSHDRCRSRISSKPVLSASK